MYMIQKRNKYMKKNLSRKEIEEALMTNLVITNEKKRKSR